MITDRNMTKIIAGYIAAAFFTESGPDVVDDPAYQIRDGDELSPEAQERAAADCRHFVELAGDLIPEAISRLGDAERIGHDLWLNRNGHGAGFWDRDELEEDGLGDRLSETCKTIGSRDFYKGDDGLLYFA